MRPHETIALIAHILLLVAAVIMAGLLTFALVQHDRLRGDGKADMLRPDLMEEVRP